MGSNGSKESCDRWGPAALRDVVMATTFWLSMDNNFGFLIASDTLFDSRDGFSSSSYPMADFEVRRDVAIATTLAFYVWSVHIAATWRIQLNRPWRRRCGLMLNYFDHLFRF